MLKMSPTMIRISAQTQKSRPLGINFTTSIPVCAMPSI